MKLISSKKAKRKISVMFLFAFVLSNLLTLIGPSAQAAVSVSQPSNTGGTCFQHTGTAANGSLVTVYNIGQVQISLTAGDITPGQDTNASAGTDSTVLAQATNAGSISANGDVVGNIVSLVPPTGTNFVIVPGFQDSGAGLSNHLLRANATISNAFSQDSTNGTADSALGVSVGVVTAGTVGVGKAIIAIARDADSASGTTAGNETYPKSGTNNNSVTISIEGLGLVLPPAGNSSLSGTLTASFAGVPSGTGQADGADGMADVAVTSAISGISGKTIDICTVTSASGQLEAVLDSDNDSSELYDKSTTSSANLLALGSISSNTRVWAFDTATLAGGVSATSLLDVEPILIRGKAGTGKDARDQVFGTGEFLRDVTHTVFAPSGSALDLTSHFGNSSTTPITVAFADDNASATSTLLAVDIVIESSTAAATPTTAGFNAAQSSRHGFLGALRAATFDTANATTNTQAVTGASWGVASVSGGPNTVAIQEALSADSTALGATGITSNTVEPFHPTFVDLRLECGSSTNPVAGWFALLNSTATGFGTTENTNQIIKRSQTGNQFTLTSVTDGNSTLYAQALTNIAGSNPVNASSFQLAAWSAAAAGTTVALNGNALLYASCSMDTLTLFPVQNGIDLQRDIIAITPLVQVTNISSTFSSDVSLIAEISGNHLTGTTQLELGKLVGALATSSSTSGSNLASAEGVALASNSQLGVTCSSGGDSNVVLSTVTSTAIDTAVSSACTSGAVAPPSAFFVGGAPNSVSGSTVIDGSPTVQADGRGVLIKELSATGFQELTNQVGGGITGTVFEIALPSGCDVIDDQDDNNTAVSTVASTAGNDVARISTTSTAGVTSTTANLTGTGDAQLTNANVLAPAAGSTPAKVRFALSATGGATDNATTDAVLVRFDSQDIFCPSTITGDLSGSVTAQNKVSSPTVSVGLGTVSFGTATQAGTFAFADDVATSTKGETSTNSNLGSSPRLVDGSVTTSHPFSITETDERSIPIGGRVSSRNLDPDNSVISTVVTKGQIWVVPSSSASFSDATGDVPTASDISFSDDSLILDGNPLVVSSATVNANAPLGSLLIPVKKNTASGAADPAASKTTITVKNAKFQAATSSTTDLSATVQFFVPDAGVVANTPGVASGNSASTPTLFTPFAPGSTKAGSQINGTGGVQLGSGTLSNQLLTNRLSDLGAPQIDSFATVLASGSLKNADSSKITVSAVGVGEGVTPATDNVVTVTGSAGAVDGGAQVEVSTSTGTTTYDSVTVFASEDGSFTAKLRGDCATASSVTVNVNESVSGSSTTSVTKTAVCGEGTSEQSVDEIVSEIAGEDGEVSIDEVLSYVEGQGGLSAIVSAGGNKLQAVIDAAKQALGLS